MALYVNKNICIVDFLHKFQMNWNMPAKDIHNFIRGNDKVPGAWTMIDGQVRKLIINRQVKKLIIGGQVRKLIISR